MALVLLTLLAQTSYPSMSNPPEAFTGTRQERIEDALRRFQDANEIPGLCFTVSYKNRLVYTFCRGWADLEKREPFTPATKCALASISKTPTAIAMVALLAKKKISLDEPAIKYLRIADPQARRQVATGFYPQMTFRHLLQHTASFGEAFSPWSRPEVAKAFGASMPSKARQNVEFELRKPLPYAPGEKFEYSNFGFLVLGRLIEDLGGMPYADFVQQRVLQPLNVSGWVMRRPRPGEQYPGECRYYESPASLYPTVYATGTEKRVPMMYGGAAYEEADACSAWVSDSMALANFASALATSRIRRVLSDVDLERMVRRPEYAGTETKYKGMGLDIERSSDGRQLAFRHGGILYGASSWFSTNFAGVAMTIQMNKGFVGRNLSWEVHQELMDAICAKDWNSEVSRGQPFPE